MPKDNNNNTKKVSNKSSCVKEKEEWMSYLSLLTLQHVPINQSFFKKVAKDLVEWSQKDDSLKINQFLSEKGILESCFYEWTKIDPSLKAAKEFALQTIGTRREIGGLNRELESTIVKYTMPKYDKSWKELEEWRAGLRTVEAEKDIPKVVVIEKFKEPENKKTPEEVAGEVSLKSPGAIRKNARLKGE